MNTITFYYILLSFQANKCISRFLINFLLQCFFHRIFKRIKGSDLLINFCLTDKKIHRRRYILLYMVLQDYIYQIQLYIFILEKPMLESNLQVQTKNILNSNHFHSIRRLGKGGFGHVLLATKATSSSTFYAVKCISKKKMIKDPPLKKFLFQQINTMASLDHPNIVKLHKTF